MGLIYETESFQIKGAAMRVYKALGSGFIESVYQECLELEFTRLGVPFLPQKKLEIRYDGLALRQAFKADFVCFDKIIVEIKAVTTLAPEHQAQVINYLKATGMQLGFLFNFGSYPLLQQLRVPNLDRR